MNRVKQGQEWTVLIVAHEPQERTRLRAALQADTRRRYHIVEAETGAQGLAVCDTQPVEGILIHNRLPDMQGAAFLAALFRKQARFVMPIVLLVEARDESAAIQAMQYGSDYLITNQFSTSALHRAISRASERSALLRKVEAQRQELKQANRTLRERAALLSVIYDVIGTGICVTDAHENFVNVNPAFCKLYGYQPEELLGTSFLRLLPPEDQEHARARHADFLAGVPLSAHASEWRSVRKDGSLIDVYVSSGRLVCEDGSCLKVSTVIDVTERRQYENRLRYQAYYDALTGLPNRALFLERLNQALQRTRQQPEALFAVILFDLDHFKIVNDSLGHPVGDHLLSTAARRLDACMRTGDMIARMGGDEFAVLLEGISSVNDVVEVANRIQQALAVPLEVREHTLFASASIGIVVSQGDMHCQPDDLLRDADSAMYQAKARGRACHAIFNAEMRAQALERLNLESGLWQALERDELRLLYQPVIDLQTGEVVSLEALLCWQHPQRGLLPSETFIRTAEESGLIVMLGRWVLRRVCQQVQFWLARSGTSGDTLHRLPVTIHINISAHEFLQPTFVDSVAQVMRDYRIDPRQFRLEISERVMGYPIEMLLPVLQRLDELGIQMCLDSIGEGLASLRHITDFPLPMVKIDRSLGSLHHTEKHGPVLQAFIGLAHALDMQVVAMKVENEHQFAQLQAMGCDYGQGFLFSRPVSAAAAGTLITQPHEQVLLVHELS